MPTTFNPVFVIALGGTGTQVARMLRDRLVWRYGDVDRIPFIEFLFVDTDHNNADAAGPDGILINPPPGNVERMLTHPEEFDHIGLKDWVDMESLKRADKGGFQQGAAGIRMFGRLAFFSAASFQNMWNQIGHKIARVNAVTDTQIKDQLGLEPDAEVQVGPTRVYVVSSSCGGTGAGSFVDMGYIVHRILSQEGIQAERLGILGIARQDATSERQYTRNTAALLSELDYYNRSGVVYEAKFPQQLPMRTRAACYDYCYLVSPSGPGGEIDFGEFLGRIAEYIYVDVIAQTQEAQSRRVDFGPDMAEFDMDGYPLRFLTFGVSSIEFPADVCHQACFHGTIRNFVEAWLHTDSRGISHEATRESDPSESDLVGITNSLGIGCTRTVEDNLLSELTAVPEELGDFAGGVRAQDWMNDQIRRTFDAELTDEAFVDLEQKLESVLGREGYFTKCVEMNTKALRSSRRLEGILLEALLPVVFDLARGPRYALGLARQLKEKLAGELRRIETELKSSRVPGYTLDDARQAVQSVRRDWLLRMPPGIGFRWINESAARRELQKPRVMVCEAYNRRAEELILKAKQELYAELADPGLTVLEARLLHLLEYLQAWHAEANESYQAIMSRPLDRRTAMLFSEDVVQLKMDRVMKDPDTGTHEGFHRSLLEAGRVRGISEALGAELDRDETRPFTASAPRDAARGGKIQLRYVDSMRETVLTRYRQRAGANQAPIIYDERVIERFQEAAVQSAGLGTEIGQVVDESMEMLPLNLQHPKYSDIQPVNPRDGWWAFFNGANSSDEWTEFKRELMSSVNAAAGTTGLTAPDPARWMQEIQDSYMVILLRERAAFPTRIVYGFDIAEREAKIHGTRSGSGLVQEMTAFARSGIRPRPPSERDMREAEQFFLGAVIMGLLEYSQDRQEFSMELAQAPGMPRRLLTLPTDFGISVGELAYRTETRTVLAQMIQEKINQVGAGEVLALATAVKDRIEVTDSGESRTNEVAKLGVRDLDDARAANIIRGFEAHFDLATESGAGAVAVHPYADQILDPPAGRRPGFYCRNRACGVFLGPDLQAIPPECPNCASTFVPYTDYR